MLTNNQVTAFLTEQAQMGLSARTRAFLQSEGINGPDDLKDFVTKEAWSQVIENCKRPPQIPDPNNAGQLINDAPYRIGAKSLMRLKVAAIAVSYYEAVDRPLTAAMLMWSPRLKNFDAQWKALQELKDNSDLELPKVTKNTSFASWMDSYEVYADQKIGVQDAPISNVIREDVVPAPAPALAADMPHSDEYGSIQEELKMRISHAGALYRDDNQCVFDDIESATRGTKYAASIAPFKRRRDGRGAFMALKAQFAGPAMWDQEARTSNEFMLSRKFSGGTSLTLERYLGQHRAAHVSIERCAEHVQCQVHDERTRVGYLLDNIEVGDADVKAALAAIRSDDTPTGMRNNFEAAVAFLLPTDPVKKKGRKSKRNAAEISSTQATGASGPPLKSGVGTTGVALRYHSPKEYAKLSEEQRDELREHRRKSGKDGKGQSKKNYADTFTKNMPRKKLRTHVAAVLKEMRSEQEAKKATLSELKAVLAELSSTSAEGVAPPSGPPKKKIAKAASDEDQAEVAAAKLSKVLDKLALGSKLKSGKP